MWILEERIPLSFPGTKHITQEDLLDGASTACFFLYLHIDQQIYIKEKVGVQKPEARNINF